MSNIQIETDLKEILNKLDQKLDNIDSKFEQKLDNIDSKFEQKLDNLQKDVTDMNLRLTKVETKLDEGVMPRLDSLDNEIREIKGSQQAQIWTLIGVLITAVGGFLVAVGRSVFFNP